MRMSPEDIGVQGSKIYVLDLNQGIFIFSLANKEFRPEAHIELPTGGNYQMRVKGTTILVLLNDQDGSKMIEIYYNQAEKRGELVRYYKSNQYIDKIDIFQAETGLSSNEESIQELAFLIVDEDYLQVYPFNIDPRMLKTLDNGLKVRLNRVRQIFHVFGPRYIVVTDDEILYYEMVIDRPKVMCNALSGNFDSLGTFRLALRSNVSTCEHYSP